MDLPNAPVWLIYLALYTVRARLSGMRVFRLLCLAGGVCLFGSGCCEVDQRPPANVKLAAANSQSFSAKGILKEANPEKRIALIQHEAISNYMAAMTMPFKVKEIPRNWLDCRRVTKSPFACV